MDGLNNETGPNLILVKTALDALIDGLKLKPAAVGRATALDPIIFTQDTADNAAKVTSVLGAGGYFQKTTNDLPTFKTEAKKAAAPRTTLIASFINNLQITRTFMMDQQQSAAARAVSQDFRSWLATRDRNAMMVYANGFTTQTTIDGVPLFSNSHVNENGDTVDNLETGVMNDDNLNILVNSLRTQLNQDGVKIGYEPDFLLTSSLGHKQAMSVAKSVLRAGTGNNDLNYYSEMYPGMQVKYNQFLDDVSTTAYFLGSEGHSVMRFEREAFFTNLVDWKTSPSDQYVYKMRAREEVDSIEYSGVAASNGTV